MRGITKTDTGAKPAKRASFVLKFATLFPKSDCSYSRLKSRGISKYLTVTGDFVFWVFRVSTHLETKNNLRNRPQNSDPVQPGALYFNYFNYMDYFYFWNYLRFLEHRNSENFTTTGCVWGFRITQAPCEGDFPFV